METPLVKRKGVKKHYTLKFGYFCCNKGSNRNMT